MRENRTYGATGGAPTVTSGSTLLPQTLIYWLLKGCPDGTIRPLSGVTRAQAAVMVWRVLRDIESASARTLP